MFGYGCALLGVVLFQPQVLMLFHSRDKIQLEIDLNGAPDTIRTCDLCLRRATLYPAELRVLAKAEGASSLKVRLAQTP